MFDTAKTIEMDGKVVKSIITEDGGVLYEKLENTILELTCSPSTVYYGDTVNLTATLTGGNVSNKNISLWASEPCVSKHFSVSEPFPLDDIIWFNGLEIGEEICIKEYSQDIDFWNGEYNITIREKYIAFTVIPSVPPIPIEYPIYIERVEKNSYNFYHSPNGEKILVTTEDSTLDAWSDFDALSNFIILSTDNNGVASTDIVCDSFTSLSVTASYNELSDSVNIIVNDKYDLDLVSDKNILSSYDNDTATLTATLTKNNSPLSNEQVLFYDSDNVSLATYYDWLDVFLFTVTSANQGEIIFDTTNAEHNNFYTEDATSGGGYSNGGRVKFVITDTQVETWRYNSNTDTWTKSMMLYNLPVKIGFPYGTEIISNTAKIPFFDSAITDSNGEATATYNSIGIGDVNIKAECVERSLVSEIYEIMDCIYFDDMSSDTTSRYPHNSYTDLTYSDGSIIVTMITENKTPALTLFNQSNLLQGKTVNVEVEAELNGVNDLTLRSVSISPSHSITIIEGVNVLENVVVPADNEQGSFIIRGTISPIGSSFKFKNVKIYPI